MSRLAMPTAEAQRRQMIMQQMLAVQNTRLKLASDIYTKIIADEYGRAQLIATHQAKQEIDPFGVRDGEDVQKEMPDQVPLEIGMNSAARCSLAAANVLLYHAGLVDDQGNPRLPGEDDGGEGTQTNNQKPSGIILGE